MNRCGRHMCPIADLCSDDAETLALAVLRYVAAGYLTSDVACWDAAYEASEHILGPVEGPDFVASMTGIVRALRRERDGDWTFMPATCCRATADECDFIDLIACARRAAQADVQAKAKAMTGGQPAPCLCVCVTAAADRMNALQFPPAQQRSPAGRAVVH